MAPANLYELWFDSDAVTLRSWIRPPAAECEVSVSNLNFSVTLMTVIKMILAVINSHLRTRYAERSRY